MEIKPFVSETFFNFKLSNQIRGLEGLLVVPENEFDRKIVDKISKRKGSGYGHILMKEQASGGLVYDTKSNAKKGIKALNVESKRLQSKKKK